MAATNWVNLYNKYKGLWVALKDDEKTVIASGKKLSEAADNAQKKGFKNPIFMQIPQKASYFIGKIKLVDQIK